VDALVVPPDLAERLGTSVPALQNFERSAPSYRRNVLRWIASAKTPETRLKRIAQTVDFASVGVKIPQM
jgi:uncharacterized protein YdeI (YjbR/CyaY-like superfamily)